MSSFQKTFRRDFYSHVRSQRALASLAFLLIFVVASLSVTTTFSFGQESGGLDLSVLDSEPDVPEAHNQAPTSQAADEYPDETAAAASFQSSGRAKLLDLAMASGWIGVVLLLASIVAVALIIRLCLLLRRSVFMPDELLRSSAEALSHGNVQRAYELASASDSFFGRATMAGLREADRGWSATEKAIEDAVAFLTAKLFRRSEPLSVIGNVAPMLGLLGTVMGMVSTFGELAVADGSGRNLANGIYFALVTTVAGLLVAIPVLVAHSLVNGRIASLVSETTEAIARTLEPLKRSRANVGPEEPPRPPVLGLQEVQRDSVDPARSDQGAGRHARPASTRPSLTLKNRRSSE